ncbi:MAG: DEAD/DEAH box helicase family protein [Lachnospiraceae bacterium]|nr:DEAD/DEAH box helicase family protein [Lachnospiraceae bacterium]
MQTMAKKETLERFKTDEIDTIIIDEVHRAGADSYQRIIQYFESKF